MEITPFSQRSLDGEGAEMLLDFKKAHQQDLKAIAEILARISHQSPEKVEILLETMLKQLIEPKTPFYVPGCDWHGILASAGPEAVVCASAKRYWYR